MSGSGWKIRKYGIPEGYTLVLFIGMSISSFLFFQWGKNEGLSEEETGIVLSFVFLLVLGITMILHNYFKGRWNNIWHRKSSRPPTEVIKQIEKTLKSGNLSHSFGLGFEEARLYVPISSHWGFCLPTSPILVIKIRPAYFAGRSKIYIGHQTEDNINQIEGIKKMIDASIGQD